MDEKLQKHISDAVVDGSDAPDDDLSTALGEDEEAAEYFEDVKALELKMREWGYEEPPRQYWKSFSSRITSRLESADVDESDDLLEAPAPDEEQELVRQSELEGGDDEGEDEAAGLGALAALAGRSTLPPAKAFEEKDSPTDGDDAVLDLGALIAGTDEKEQEAKPKEKPGRKEKEAVAPAAKAASASVAAASPSTTPAAAQQKPSNTLYYIVGVLAVALFIVGYIAFGTNRDEERTDDQQTVAMAPSEPSAPAVEEPLPAVEPARDQVEQPTEDQVGEGEAELGEGEAEAEDEGEGEGEGTSEATGLTRHAARSAAKRSPSAEPSASPPPSPASTSTARESSTPSSATPTKAAAGPAGDLDALLAGATAPVRAPSKAGSGSAGEAVQAAMGPGETGNALPTQPSRSQVRRAMGSVAGQVMACRSLVESQTRVNATVNVSNSGAVQSASVSGGTPAVQQCVQRAVQRARFPRFSEPSFSVTYPFVLSPEE